MDAIARFWSKVLKTDSCWLWKGAPTKQGRHRGNGGYGRFYFKDEVHLAHRYSYQMLVGPIPFGMEIDHLCRNRICVNPAHLEAVTPQINQHRGMSNSGLNARKTHCPKGHPYSGDNLIMNRNKRYCRACERLRWRNVA